MRSDRAAASLVGILGAAALLALAVQSACAPAGEVRADAGLEVRRAALRRDVLLTGELAARESVPLVVPPVPNWNVSVKWIADDGKEVKEGEPLVELDTTPLLVPLKESTTAATTAAHEIARLRSEGQATELGKELELLLSGVEVEKARLDTSVPEEIVAAWERQQRRLALARAEAGHEKAEEGLVAARVGARADVGVQELEHARAMSDIEAAERTIDSYTLHAPRDGVLLVADHPWFGRKIEMGDMLYEGRLIASLPQIGTLRVEAKLSDVDDGAVVVGQSADVVLDSFPGESYTGKVTRVGDVAQESARSSARRSFEVIVDLDRIDEERMLPGQSAKVVVHGAEVAERLLVPRAALSYAKETPTLRTETGEEVAVELGPCSSSECVLVSPELPAGTRLLRAGAAS